MENKMIETKLNIIKMRLEKVCRGSVVINDEYIDGFVVNVYADYTFSRTISNRELIERPALNIAHDIQLQYKDFIVSCYMNIENWVSMHELDYKRKPNSNPPTFTAL